MPALDWSLAIFVFAGAVPLVAGCYQFVLADLQALVPSYRRAQHERQAVTPRVAIVIPAWNEERVLARTLDQLMRLDYPPDRVRAYVVDDGSTDGTPAIAQAKSTEYPGRIFHLRREHGGEGKAHTINHGLRQIQSENWYEAVLIIDADVILTPNLLPLLAGHLARPGIGAATAYIKEGSRPANYMNRFVAFEYITAQAGARRAQNVLGAQACLPGGAQLITRESLEAIGGQIDPSTLAEDTVTSFRIQLTGRRVAFEPRAVAWAEEPRDVAGLWRQRVRWARGNVQVTLGFHRVWLRRGRYGPLGGASFALLWFSVTLMPVFMLLASTGLVVLFEINRVFAHHLFRSLWGINLVTYGFVTASSCTLDLATARRAWREALFFPGAVSLLIMLYAAWPALYTSDGAHLLRDIGITPTAGLGTALVLFTYIWLAGSMFAAMAVKCLEGRLRPLVAPLVYLVGYGPLLCAMTVAGYTRELRRAEMRWEKTEKRGALGELA